MAFADVGGGELAEAPAAVLPLSPEGAVEQQDEAMQPMNPLTGEAIDDEESGNPVEDLEEAIANSAFEQKIRTWVTLGSCVLWLVLTPLAALVYQSRYKTAVVDLPKAREDFKGQDFAYGPFSCFEDREVCLWSFFCPSARWADTMGAAGMLSFVVAFGVFFVLCIMNMLQVGVMAWFFAALVFTYYRQQLRKVLTLRNEGDDQVKDFAMWAFCCCFAVGQEARQLKLAGAKDQHEVPATANGHHGEV